MFNGLSPKERLALLAKVVKDDVEHSHEDEGEEEEMDITHLISTADGVMSYKDPETGESVVISDDSIDDDELIEDDDEEDLLKNMSPEERLEMISKIVNDKQGDAATVVLDHLEERKNMDDEADAKKPMTTPFASSDSSQPAIVQVGDEVEVYIKSVYKQSGRFMVTLDPSVQGRKPKDMKRESDVEKKLARLAEKGWNFDRIDELKGTECDGVVQAISNTGDWCYVKAALEDLPVGVANLSPDLSVSKGDSVHVRIDGIDESRGQIAMTVI
jgi:predicted RNA-binding protein with TRAM domain